MQTVLTLDHPDAADVPTAKRFIVEAVGFGYQLFDMVLPVQMTEEQQIWEAQKVLDLKRPGWTVTSMFVQIASPEIPTPF